MAGESSNSIIINVTGDDNRSALFGKYILGEVLGRGAFAEVYQAEHDLSGKDVAIKVLQRRRIKGDLTARIQREISIMRRLRHPHVILLYEVLATKKKVYFVMELARGGVLFPRTSTNPFPESRCRKYFRQLISAVRYCHARGVFHRDIKSENLLLDTNGDLKVADFGLGAVKEQMDSYGMLHTHCGSPSYMAPEVLSNRGYEGSKADIWSCGVVLFLLNAGNLPFRDTNLYVLYSIIRTAQYTMPAHISPELQQLLRRLLEPNPENRITIEEILQDPWFNHDVDPGDIIGVQADDYDLDDYSKTLNAFDLMVSAPMRNLSGLFRRFVSPDQCDQFVSDETPAEIMGKVVEVAEQMNLRIAKRKERVMKLEGPNGVTNAVIKIRTLPDELVIVDIKNKQRDVDLVWADEFRQKLRRLVNQPVYRPPDQL